jgi:hypothetical protein
MVAMAEQLCEYTRNQRTVHSKWVIFMVYEFYLDKLEIAGCPPKSVVPISRMPLYPTFMSLKSWCLRNVVCLKDCLKFSPWLWVLNTCLTSKLYRYGPIPPLHPGQPHTIYPLKFGNSHFRICQLWRQSFSEERVGLPSPCIKAVFSLCGSLSGLWVCALSCMNFSQQSSCGLFRLCSIRSPGVELKSRQYTQ